jgi:hypothetical protein
MAGLLALTSATLCAQEQTITWTAALIWLGIGLACCAFCRMFLRLLERKRDAINWRILRLWWPTIMLICGWILALLISLGQEGSWLEVVGGIFVLVNLPAWLILAVMIEILGLVHLPVWINILVCSVTLWGGDYLFICWAERRAWSNVPLSLHLTTNVHPKPQT